LQEHELFVNIVKTLNEAIIAIDLNGKVRLWNKSAERLFGYKEKEVLGKTLPFIKTQFTYELETMISKAKEGLSINFKTTKQTKEGNEVELVVHANPIYKNNSPIGVAVMVQEASTLKKVCYLPFNLETPHKEPKRTFAEIRDLIFLTLESGKKTINQISNESGINWRTVEKHLTYLIGKKLVNEVFSSEYVRIFELTLLGGEYLNGLKTKELQKHLKKA